ncbi:hypothetical protein [Pyrococcus horikoshii]|uniref:Uncharacterized protein n=1 Tax=Pyrococcus horikoshii TaxID=53953 RepID=A0A832T6U6_PYRHR|nr:hypothetical protein [Pyrococcus horikoshii]HII61283.1 hypothetical protein [Pyrococcus horikoshii]
MRLLISLLKLLFFEIPRIMFGIAKLFRIKNKGERMFKKVLREEGLPEDVIQELYGSFAIKIRKLIYWRQLEYEH